MTVFLQVDTGEDATSVLRAVKRSLQALEDCFS